MCGIIAVLRRRSRRTPPDAAELRRLLQAAGAPPTGGAAALHEIATAVEQLNRLLLGPPGIEALRATPQLDGEIDSAMAALGTTIGVIEAELDAGEAALSPTEIERTNAALVRLKDAVWAVGEDRLRAARAVFDFCGRDSGSAAIAAFASIHSALSALDRLEVRGRDSAGLQVTVTGHGLDLDSPAVGSLLAERCADPLFTSRAVRTPRGQLVFVYKAAAEIGELGDNCRALRRAIGEDPLLRMALENPAAEATVLGHTRWASVGIISQANAHPLNQEEPGLDGPFATAVLNGDVDNYADLKAREHVQVAAEVTTDAKIIPVLMSRRLAAGQPLADAFRDTVASFVGSIAIGATAADHPDRILLALRGSGQALYVGMCEDAYVVASEPYGLVEETNTYLRMDGETPGNPDNPAASQGQIIVLDRERAGTPEGLVRHAYDGTALPVREAELQTAEITTRDINRGSYRHFLLKEISEAPESFRKTLRGKIAEGDGRLRVELGDQSLPVDIRRKLRASEFRRIYVIGQGTAAVAGQGVAALMSEAMLASRVPITAMPATELSGFKMAGDMADVLVVAISQSGTTTDTNRTVDLLRARGAKVIAIVNRRNSDLTDKADGVLYTSDGRDVEMSVASTKAFYAQVAAGALLAFAVAEETGCGNDALQHEMLSALRKLPAAMAQALELRDHIGEIAARHAPARRYWALVGNGNNRIAAQEIRIKLSELCYKSIACDTTEDKKHIDLSSEPLILVCAAGLVGSNADDVAKEIEIYRAHKAAPIVIASAGESRFSAALEVIGVPAVHPSLDFILSAVAGHLFGYEAALAIDGLARPLRVIRSAIEQLVPAASDGHQLLPSLWRRIETEVRQFFAHLARNAYDGHMEASTAVRIASLLRFVAATTPLESFAIEHGRPGTPAAVIEELTTALTRGIEELTRPVDAIKHQAKTVTVGISRSDEGLLTVPLVAAVLAGGAARDHLSYRDLLTLAAIDPAIEKVLGHTRYHIEGEIDDDSATIRVVASGGIAENIPSRTSENPELRGTKHQIAVEQRVLVACGARDQRTVVIVPEVEGNRTVGLTLLHVLLADTISTAAMRGVLRGYRRRYDALRDTVTETEPSFREDLLATLPVVELLTTPITALAQHWR